MRFSPLVERIDGPSVAAWDIHSAAVAAKRRGEGVILLSVGDPDFATPDPVTEAAVAALHAGDTHYTDVPGRCALREALAAMLGPGHGRALGAENVVLTAGAQNALFCASLCLLAPRDGAIRDRADVSHLRGGAVAERGASRARADAGGRRLPAGRRGDRGGGDAPDAGDRADDAEQSDRRRRAPRRVGGDRGDRAPARPRRRRRRGLCAARLRGRACLDREPSRHGGADGHDRLALEVACDDRLARRLDRGERGTLRTCGAAGARDALRPAGLHPGGGAGGVSPLRRGHGGDARALSPEARRRRRGAGRRAARSRARAGSRKPEAGMFVLLDVRESGLSAYDFAWRLFRETGISTLDATAFGPPAEGFLRVAFTQGEERLEEACRRIRRFAEGL